MPGRLLYSVNIVKACAEETDLLDFYAGSPPVICKQGERRAQIIWQMLFLPAMKRETIRVVVKRYRMRSRGERGCREPAA